MPLSPGERNLALWGGIAGLTIAAIFTAIRGGGKPALAFATAPALPPHDPRPWEQQIWEQADIVEEMTNWPGLANFLVAVAYTESRGVPTACAGSCGPNAARGWFGLRPDSARITEFSGGTAATLYKTEWSTAMAAWYAARLGHNWNGPGQTVNWLAIRRGWALPRLVDDVDETEFVEGWGYGGRSKHVRENFTEALQQTGQPVSFMYEPAFAPDWKWPGNVQDASSVLPILDALDAPAP